MSIWAQTINMNAPQISPRRTEWMLFKGTFCSHRSNDWNEPIISYTTADQLEMCCAAFTPSPGGLFRTAPDEILFSPQSLTQHAPRKHEAGRQRRCRRTGCLENKAPHTDAVDSRGAIVRRFTQPLRDAEAASDYFPSYWQYCTQDRTVCFAEAIF